MATLAEAALRPEERRTLSRLLALLKAQFGPDLRAMWLFGSRARGEGPEEESDIDLIVLTAEGSYEDQDRVIDLVFEAADAEGGRGAFFSAHVRSPEWVEERRAIEDFFIHEVDRDKIVLYGEP